MPMNATEIISQRLINQQIAATSLKKPVEIVRWFGAMQSQEYAMAKWAIGMRLPGIKDAAVEEAFNRGEILRTHIMRPTWHFVLPEDIKWMQKLTSPRVHTVAGSMYRKLGLDKKVFKKSTDLIAKALQNENYLNRTELKAILEKAKLSTDTVVTAHYLMYAELECVICSGPRKGKQFTYALMDERAPKAKELSREESLAELARRYFTSRAPATANDFSWWSGLTIEDAKKGIAGLGKDFYRVIIDKREYVCFGEVDFKTSSPKATFLMPDYDEYGIAYKNRNEILPPGNTNDLFFSHLLVIDGKVAGTWSQEKKGKSPEVKTKLFIKLNKRQEEGLKKAVKRFHDFIS
jgi:hypothetical protein